MKLGTCTTIYRKFIRLLSAQPSGALSWVLNVALMWGATASLVSAEGGVQKPKPVDVVLLFDTSGSMLKTDPNLLRYEGAKQMSEFLGKGDRFGIVGFSDRAQTLQTLQPFSEETASAILDHIEKVRTEGQYTDIFAGIKASQEVLELDRRSGVERAILLISDGKMEPPPEQGLAFARTLSLIHELLPVLKAQEIRVYSIALSEDADRALLREISGATGGIAFYAETAEELAKAFALLFEAMVPTHSSNSITRSFNVENGVDEAIFYVEHDSQARITIESPRGEPLSTIQKPEGVAWFSGGTFDVITIREPDGGDWQVQGIEPSDSFVTMMDHLKVAIDWPASVRSEQPELLKARLYEKDKPVALPQVSKNLKVNFKISASDRVSAPILEGELNDDGRDGDKVAHDGIFSSMLSFKDVGGYRVDVSAKSPTFDRRAGVGFKVKPRLITLKALLHGSETEHANEHEANDTGEAHEGKEPTDDAEHNQLPQLVGDETTLFQAEVSKEVASFKNVSVVLIARTDDMKRFEIPLKRSPTSGFLYERYADTLPRDGQYTIHAEIRGVERGHKEAQSATDPITFVRKTSAQHVETAAHVVVRQEIAHEEQKPPAFPLVPVTVISLVNILLGAAAYLFLRKKPTVRNAPTPKYIPQKSLLDAISDLEGRVAKTDVSIDDPIFGQGKPSEDRAAEAKPGSDAAKEANP